MSKHLFFLDAGKEGIHVSRMKDGSISIQTTNKDGHFQSGVMVPLELLNEFAGRFVGSVIHPSVIKGELTQLRRFSIMANTTMPKLGERVKFITNKGTEVVADVVEAPPRPGLDDGVIVGLYVLDPTGPYFRKDVEFRSEVGGWQWLDHPAEDAISSRAAMDSKKKRNQEEETPEPESAVGKAAAELNASNDESNSATGTTPAKKASAKKGSKK